MVDKALNLIPVILLLVLINPIFVSSQLTESDKIFIQQENQKIIAQQSSKIDTQVNRIEKNLASEVEQSRNIIIDEMSKSVNSSLKSVAIGLSGMIIVTLAIFKIVEAKLNYNNQIKKYETELKNKITYLNDLIEKNEKYKTKLSEYKVMLEQKINNYSIVNPDDKNNQLKTKLMDNSATKSKKPNFFIKNRKYILIVLGIVFIGLLAWTIYNLIIFRTLPEIPTP